MTVCTRCHRPLSRPTETGMGPVCAARAKAAAPLVVERDLFGFDVDRAARAAQERVQVVIASATADAHMAVKRQFRAARANLGVWA